MSTKPENAVSVKFGNSTMPKRIRAFGVVSAVVSGGESASFMRVCRAVSGGVRRSRGLRPPRFERRRSPGAPLVLFRLKPSAKRISAPRASGCGGGIPRRCRFCSICGFYALVYWRQVTNDEAAKHERQHLRSVQDRHWTVELTYGRADDRRVPVRVARRGYEPARLRAARQSRAVWLARRDRQGARHRQGGVARARRSSARCDRP